MNFNAEFQIFIRVHLLQGDSDLERSASSRIAFLHLAIFCSVLRLLKRTDQLFEVILHEKKPSSNVNKVID
jgi:hypothetical protein